VIDRDDRLVVGAWERMERQVLQAMRRVRESVVALEYTPSDGPAGSRRVATGVVINLDGDVLSIRIDRPGATSSMAATRASASRATGRGMNQEPGADARSGAATEPVPTILARDASGRRHEARWLASDPETGLTLLRIAPRLIRPVRLSTRSAEAGFPIFVVGNPFGLGHSISRGHIAGLGRRLELGTRQLGGLIQVHAPLYPGDSGAAVASLRGEWLGLIRGALSSPTSLSDSPSIEPARRNQADAAATERLPAARPGRDLSRDSLPADSELTSNRTRDHDIGFAIPADDALWVADQLREHGYVDRSYLGVRLEAVPPPVSGWPLAHEYEAGEGGLAGAQPAAEMESTGALLSEVLRGSPADQAGLRAGDRIVSINGRPIRSAIDLTDQLDRIRADSQVLIELIPGSQPSGSLATVLDEAPGPGPEAGRLAREPATSSPDSRLPSRSRPGPRPNAGVRSGSGLYAKAGARSNRSRTVSLRTASRPLAVEQTSHQVDGAPPSQPSPSALSSPSATPTLGDRSAESASANVAAPPAGLRANDLELTIPRAVSERLDRMERRLERLENELSRRGHESSSAALPAPRSDAGRLGGD
jgi:S1-C subfamily serine protease